MLANLILMNWFLSIGFMPASSLEIDENTILRSDNSFFQIIGVNFNIAETVNIFTDIEIRDTKGDSVYFLPYRADFTIGLEAYYKNFIFRITHECNHDVITGNEFNKYNGLEGAWMNIYLKTFREFEQKGYIFTPVISLGFRPYDNLYIKPIDKAVNYFGNKFLYGRYNNTIFCQMSATIDAGKYFTATVSFQPEYSFENKGWDIMGRIGAEGKYRNIALGVDWKMQKRFSKEGYAINELMMYLIFRGNGSFL